MGDIPAASGSANWSNRAAPDSRRQLLRCAGWRYDRSFDRQGGQPERVKQAILDRARPGRLAGWETSRLSSQVWLKLCCLAGGGPGCRLA